MTKTCYWCNGENDDMLSDFCCEECYQEYQEPLDDDREGLSGFEITPNFTFENWDFDSDPDWR